MKFLNMKGYFKKKKRGNSIGPLLTHGLASMTQPGQRCGPRYPGRWRRAERPRRDHCARDRHRSAVGARVPGAPRRLGRHGEDQRDPAYLSGKVAQTGAHRADPATVRRRKARAAATASVLVDGGAPLAVSAGRGGGERGDVWWSWRR
jgi:hypothetical protein